jgi:hypothetical protein
MSDIKFDTKRIGLAIAKLDDDIERSDALLFYDLQELRGKKPIKTFTRKRLIALLEHYLNHLPESKRLPIRS